MGTQSLIDMVADFQIFLIGQIINAQELFNMINALFSQNNVLLFLINRIIFLCMQTGNNFRDSGIELLRLFRAARNN